ncbi:MAG: sigma-70 family RNA polymerase sigma factor [Pirellulales bacterium]|nr:sigma-70 family RNA polymerase sigma factor [Pirellulales bacterium]
MHTEYRNPVIRWLGERQCHQASSEALLKQLEATESVIAGLEPNKSYAAAKIVSEIVGESLPEAGNRKIPAADLQHDLRLLIEDLSDIASLSADAVGEQVFTVEQLARQFNVSTKTISRWRAIGLVSRRLVFDGRKRVGFLRSSVDRFVKNNSDRVQRGSRFSQLTEQQRQDYVDRARQMAHAGGGQAEIARQLAERTGRSVETIRTALRLHDLENPDKAVFPAGGGPLTDLQKTNIFRAYCRGTSVEKLCGDYNRTKTTVYRVINEMRAERIADLPLDYMENPRFSRKGAEKTCLGPLPRSGSVPRKPKRPTGLPPYLASLYEIRLLTKEQEQHLFRAYNFLKFQAARLREQLDLENPKSSLMDEIERLYAQIVDTKNKIARCNLRLVVSIAKRHVSPDQNFFELVSDGNLSLLRAIEKFDFALGNKFSTYASWAIMKNYARTIPGEYRLRDRFRTSHDEVFDLTQEHRGNPVVEEARQQDRVAKIQRVLQQLDDRERQIIVGRFGLDHSREPRTLKEVGAELGVTKERIRQIEARALHKLRVAAQEQQIALDL